MPVSLTFNADPANGYDVVDRLFLHADHSSAFSSIVIDGPGGLLANMDMATDALGRSIGAIILTYWPGIIDPRIAARQIGFLHTAGGGRLSLRLLAESSHDSRRHVAAIRELGETIDTFKKIWRQIDGSSQRPLLRLGGGTGAALRLAARHADIFELPPGDPEAVASVIDRLETVRRQLDRRDRIRLALPIRVEAWEGPLQNELLPSAGELIYRGCLTRLAPALAPYFSLGVDEIMVGGIARPAEIDRFERDAASDLLGQIQMPPPDSPEISVKRRVARASGGAARSLRGH